MERKRTEYSEAVKRKRETKYMQTKFLIRVKDKDIYRKRKKKPPMDEISETLIYVGPFRLRFLCLFFTINISKLNTVLSSWSFWTFFSL